MNTITQEFIWEPVETIPNKAVMVYGRSCGVCMAQGINGTIYKGDYYSNRIYDVSHWAEIPERPIYGDKK